MAKRSSKKLRDSKIVAGAISGKSNSAIARELKIDRETVARVLNSDDIRKLTEEIDGALAGSIGQAVKNIAKAVKAGSVDVSIKLLKNFGSMRETMKLEHTGKDGEPLGRMSDEELDAKIKSLMSEVGEKGGS